MIHMVRLRLLGSKEFNTWRLPGGSCDFQWWRPRWASRVVTSNVWRAGRPNPVGGRNFCWVPAEVVTFISGSPNGQAEL